jgi:hypothetical protein
MSHLAEADKSDFHPQCPLIGAKIAPTEYAAGRASFLGRALA